MSAMSKHFLAALGLAMVLGRPGVAEDVPFRAAADRSVDVAHLKLDLEVFLSEKRVAGVAELSVRMRRPVRTLRLNAVDLDVQSVQIADGAEGRRRPVPFENTGTELVIDFGRPMPRGTALQIAIQYEVRDPKSGLHFFGPSEAEPDTPLTVWSQGEPESNRYWFPCLDHPNERQTSEMIVTVPQGFEVISNGVLVSRQERPEDGTVRFHWKQGKPHVAYLVSLVVGQFAVGRNTWRGRPVLYYVPPDRAADIDRTFGRTVEMLQFFSQRFGIDYPWEKYAQVVVEQFVVGGMENTSATTLHRRVMHDRRASLDSSPDRLIAHELGHQWWGDLVTCKDWSHLWLNEGFATYCEVLWTEHKLGRDERDYLLYQKSRSARTGPAETRPVVDRRYPTAASMFDTRAYPKAGWVLHMLRCRLGDEDFFEGLKQYGTRFAYRTVETSDFRKVMEQVSALSLERFFYDWTERPGHPKLTVKTTHLPEDRLVKVSVTQTQKGEAFRFPFRAELICAEKEEPVAVRFQMTEKEHTVYVPVPGRPTLVRIDPRFTLLATIDEVKSRDLWEAQARGAPTVPERLRAVEYFAKKKQAADRDVLIQVLQNDPFYGVRVEAAAALGRLGGTGARDALIAGLSQQNPKVRRACATALGRFARDSVVAESLRKKLEQGDESYFVEAALIESLARVERSVPLKLLRHALERPSHDEVIRKAALRGLGRAKQPEALEALLEWTGRGHPRDCRITAIAALADSAKRNELARDMEARLVKRLTGYLQGEGPRIRQAAVTALGRLGPDARTAVERLETVAEHDANSRVRAAASKAVEQIRGDRSKAEQVKQLRKQMEELRRKNRELEDRVRRLEAKLRAGRIRQPSPSKP
ncbi:MAG TPA: hypothetical protein EYP14_14810 [Planctomycetaceae bacterium]|nr:hypothetical protein [Planctomycetaceae bacterium]